MIDYLDKETIGEMKIMTNESNVKNIADTMLDPFYTLKEVIARVEKNEKDIAENKKDKAENKKDKAVMKRIIMEELGLTAEGYAAYEAAPD